MKKNLIIASLALATISAFIVGCSKEIDAPEEQEQNNPQVVEEQPGIPFELIANTDEETKTTVSAGDIVWEANNQLSVFYAETGESSYSSNRQFTITSENLAAQKFTGTLEGSFDDSKNYDWYIMYPYNSNIASPTDQITSYAWQAIGSANKGTNQVQTGNSNMNHLSGQYFPLYGKVENLEGTSIPSATLKQALAVVRVRVTNSCAADLTVTSVGFTAPEDIVGTYWINFSGATPSFKKSGDDYVASTASLTVNSGSALTTGNTADFYLGIKPITVAKDEYITVTVNGKSKKITMTKATDFVGGKIKTINFNYKDYVELPWESAPEGEGVTSSSLAKVDGVTVSAGSDYASGPYWIKFDESSRYITIKTDSEIDAVSIAVKKNGSSITSELIVYESSNGSTWNEIERFTINDAVFTTSEEFASTSRFVKLGFNKTSGNAGIGRITISKPSTSPRIVADPIVVSALGATDAYSDYEARNFVGSDDVEVKGFTGCVTAATIDGGRIKYSVAPTYGTANVAGTITLQSAEASDKVVKVTQTGDEFAMTGASGSPLVLTIPDDEEEASITILSEVFGWDASVTPAIGKDLALKTGLSTTASSTSGTKNASPQTITVCSSEEAPASGDPLTLGTLVVYRNGNASDTQKYTITVKKAVSGSSSAVTYTWSLPFTSTTNSRPDDDETEGCELAPYTGTGNLNGGSWTNGTPSGASYFNTSSHFRITVPITSATSTVSVSGKIFNWASKKYQSGKTITITYYTSKKSTEASVSSVTTSADGPVSFDCEIDLPASYIPSSDGTFTLKLACGSGNFGFGGGDVVVTVE